MLDREFDLDVERLGQQRGDDTSFFAFADTVVARAFRGTAECHGWMGIKFQSRANDQPSQAVMHVRMLDEETSAQRGAGHGGSEPLLWRVFLSHVPEELIESLLDSLTTRRIEIDMLEFSGIEFRNVDNRIIMALKLVQLGLSGAATFGRTARCCSLPTCLPTRPFSSSAAVFVRSPTSI